MNILVTGATGFVGSAVIRRLVEAGHIVRAAARDPTSLVPLQGMERVALDDLSGPVNWDDLTSGVDVVIHLAGIASREEPDHLYDIVIRKATADLATACARNRVGRLIFVSSIGAQTGSSADQTVRETDVPRPDTAYDQAKLAAEDSVRLSGVPFVVLRPVVIYGPGAKANISNLLRIAALPVPLPFGLFHNERSYLALENMVGALLFCLQGASTHNETFIVSDPEPISLSDLFACLRRAHDRSPNLISVPIWMVRVLMAAAGQSEKWEKIGGSLVARPEKLLLAGWIPTIDTDSGFKLMVSAPPRPFN